MSDLVERLRGELGYNSLTGVFTWLISRGGHVEKGRTAGSIDSNGYRLIEFYGKKYKAHRLAWLFTHGEWPADEIDHINHNSTDNRLVNLRVVTHTDNQRCQKPRKRNDVLGVGWHKSSLKWVAYIRVNGKDNHLGLYPDWFDAVCARKSADNKYGFHTGHGR